jgi:hypothetical protein
MGISMDNQANTKLVYIICDQGVEPDALAILRGLGHEHWTRWTDCSGSGETGLREGNPVWPGLNTVMMVVMQADEVEPLVKKLHHMRDTFPITPGLKIIVTDAIMI